VTVDFGPIVRSRLQAADLHVPPETLRKLVTYLDVLALWNRRINLTAFHLDRPSAAAIDRLIVEPLAAAAAITTGEALAIDIGSGGGSPALPLKIAMPSWRMVLVESRERKSAFLREAVRQLDLADVAIKTERLGAHGLPQWNGAADYATMRAVRAEEQVWRAIARLLRPTGQVLWFRDRAADTSGLVPEGWVHESRPLVGGSVLAVVRPPA
jgi:16S rRNA (guanine527-N7)-methyltransferase